MNKFIFIWALFSLQHLTVILLQAILAEFVLTSQLQKYLQLLFSTDSGSENFLVTETLYFMGQLQKNYNFEALHQDLANSTME